MARANILVVDDEPLIGGVFTDYFAERGFQVDVAADAYQALELAASNQYDLIFLDIKMPGMDGVEALEGMKGRQLRAQFILMTGYWDQTQYLQERAEKIGIFRLINKPFEMDDILPLVEEALAAAGK